MGSEAMYATDRQIIERLLIPAMMQVVLTGFRDSLGEDAGILDPVNALLDQALREPLANLPADRVAKLVRRSKRVTTEAMAVVAGQSFGAQYLTLARFTADLTERDVLVVGAESPFAQAWELMAEIITLGWDKLGENDAEATAAALKLSRVLSDLGIFTG